VAGRFDCAPGSLVDLRTGEWIPFLRQSCVVQAQDFARLLAHFTIGTAFFRRDCVFRVAACNHALSGASLFFEGRSAAAQNLHFTIIGAPESLASQP
jgi:hypothetical protein